MSQIPQQPPGVPLQYASRPPGEPGVREVGLAQRRLMWVILGAIVLLLTIVFSSVLIPNNGGMVMVMMGVLTLVRLALVVVMMITIFQMAKALGSGTTTCVLYVIAMLIPLINLLVLLSVNSKATAFLKRHQIKVGLMGAALSDLPPE